MDILKNLKRIFIWFGIIIAITVTLYTQGLTIGPNMFGGEVLGTKVDSPGFGPLLEQE